MKIVNIIQLLWPLQTVVIDNFSYDQQEIDIYTTAKRQPEELGECHMYNNIVIIVKVGTLVCSLGWWEEGELRVMIHIDKALVYTPNYSVNKNATITLERPPVDYSTGEELKSEGLWLDGFRTVSGKTAYYNDEYVNITIGRGMFRVYFNPSKIIHGNNLQPVDYDQFIESIRLVENIIDRIGVKIVIDKCKLSRIDLCRDIETNQKVDRYISALKLIVPRYMPEKVAIIKKGSYLMSNRSRQYVVYDKLAQAGLGAKAKHLLRFEIRFMNKATINNSFSVATLGELKTRSVFNRLSDIYNTVLKKDFFRRDTSSARIDKFDTDIEFLRHLKQVHPNKAFDHFLFHKLITGTPILQLDDLVTIMTESGYAKTTIHTKKKLYLWLLEIKSANKSERINFSELLREMYDKLIS